MSKPLLRPMHCGLSVGDIQASIDWYEKMLGFKLVSRKRVEMLHCEVAFLKSGDFEIELFRHDHSIPLPPERREPDKDIQIQGIKHLCYEVEDITSLFKELRSKGVDIVFGPHRMEGTLMGFIRDNAGNLIELMQKNPSL